MVEPRFCENLECFHQILGDATLPEGTIKQKSKPPEISIIFGYDKNTPSTDLPIFHVQCWHHFGEHFSNNSGVGFRHSKMQKIQSTLAFPLTLPRTHHRRGGNQAAPRRHPGGIQEPRELQKASFSQIITTLLPNAKSSPDL